jgi:hypothetical protein
LLQHRLLLRLRHLRRSHRLLLLQLRLRLHLRRRLLLRRRRRAVAQDWFG